MLDLSTEKGRIIAAAMKLAAIEPWRSVSLRDIAEEAQVPLDVLRRNVGSKTQVVALFMRAVDDAVLRGAPQREAAAQPRDLLFEVIMARLDAMTPYKAAVRSILADTAPDSTLAKAALNSQRWMLLAAGADADGLPGLLRTGGLASIYASVLRTWLDDDDPGLARTMAALDRRLRRGESAMGALDGLCNTVRRVGEMLRSRGPRPRTEPGDAPSGGSAYGGPAAPVPQQG